MALINIKVTEVETLVYLIVLLFDLTSSSYNCKCLGCS